MGSVNCFHVFLAVPNNETEFLNTATTDDVNRLKGIGTVRIASVEVHNAWVVVPVGFRGGGETRRARSGSGLDARIANSGVGSTAALTHTLIVSPCCITTYLTNII